LPLAYEFFRLAITTLLVFLLSLVVHNVEELELVNALGRRHDTQPVTKLLLLEELLRPRTEESTSVLVCETIAQSVQRESRTGT
jgi:hypothetical protein